MLSLSMWSSLVHRFVANPPEKPTLIFDGDCAFCRRSVECWTRGHRGESEVVAIPFQEQENRFPEIKTVEFEKSVYLVEPGGRVSNGAEAILRFLSHSTGRKHPLLRLYLSFYPAVLVMEMVYRLIARLRKFL